MFLFDLMLTIVDSGGVMRDDLTFNEISNLYLAAKIEQAECLVLLDGIGIRGAFDGAGFDAGFDGYDYDLQAWVRI